MFQKTIRKTEVDGTRYFNLADIRRVFNKQPGFDAKRLKIKEDGHYIKTQFGGRGKRSWAADLEAATEHIDKVMKCTGTLRDHVINHLKTESTAIEDPVHEEAVDEAPKIRKAPLAKVLIEGKPERIPAEAAIPVKFQDAEIPAIIAIGKIWVAVRGVCKSLGLSISSQQEKLWKDKRFSCTVISTGPLGISGELFCIALDDLSGWLYLINPNKVDEAARPKLEAYQKELTQAINDYVTKGIAVKDLPPAPEKANVSAELELVKAEVKRIKAFAETAKLELAYYRQQAEASPAVPVPVKSLRAQINEHVRGYAFKRLVGAGLDGDQHTTSNYLDDLWNFIYREFRNATGIDAKRRFQNAVKSGAKGIKHVLDVLDDTQLQQLLMLIKTRLPVDKYNVENNFSF